MAKLSAGAGYKYLLRHTCSADAHRDAGTSLTAYYTATGYPPGQWSGGGLAGLGGEMASGVATGSMVEEDAMARLYGEGRDPVTGVPLGKAYPVFRPAANRVATAIAGLADSLSAQERADAISAIEAVEARRRTPVAVAGFDLTFTIPKSASVLWGLADPKTQILVVQAHRRAVADSLAFVETHALFTRVGTHSCAQVATRGMLAASFEHWDSRTSDPNLHTHVVIANRVQGKDGKWRSVDSRALHHAAVAVSELYDDLVADNLATVLPVRWGWRDRGPARTPAFEVDGIGDDLLTEFSTRSTAIDAAMRERLAGFHADHGRGPSRVEILRLRQQTTRATRPPKSAHPLADLMRQWRDRALRRTGLTSDQIAAAALGTDPTRRGPLLRCDQVPAGVVERLAVAAVDGTMTRRSTWTRWNLLAETARLTRGLRLLNAQERIALHEIIADAAVAQCVPLDAPGLFTVPEQYCRSNGSSVFTRSGEAVYTDQRVLDAEQRLLTATQRTDAPVVANATARRIATEPLQLNRASAPVMLAPDQVDAVVDVATSGRLVDVLVGPAGTGKTTTLLALRIAWETTHGQGAVLGLAPSATAAAELSAALRIGCENTAKWVFETTGPAGLQRTEALTSLTARRSESMQLGDETAVARIDAAIHRLGSQARQWSLRPGHLVIVDEASLAGTAMLDTLVQQAQAARAKVLLVGDHQQLSAVDAGGAFGLLAGTPSAQELTSLWRFKRRWEANASRLLRRGDPAALDAYTTHDRISSGPVEEAVETAYARWRDTQAAGRSSILLAADAHTVQILNTRAHDDRVAAGLVATTGVPGANGVTVAVGDRVVTRRNNRRLTLPIRGHIRNGALWNVTATHSDGSLTLSPAERRTTSHTQAPVEISVPADYVRDHVELGYASTVHRAQGITVEQSHVLAGPGMTRQALYVAMTRGRSANYVYVSTDRVDAGCSELLDPGTEPTARTILEQILASDARELSATETLRRQQDRAASLATLVPIRATLLADADIRRWTRLLPVCGLTDAECTRVLEAPAVGALIAALRVGDADGHPMTRILTALIRYRPLPAAEELDSDIAAVLHERVTDWLQAHPPGFAPPVHNASSAPVLPRLRLGSAVDADDPAAAAIKELDDLIGQRIHALTLDALTTKPLWARPSDKTVATNDDRERHRRDLATIAAYRDLYEVADASGLGPDRSRDRTERLDRLAAGRATRTLHHDQLPNAGVDDRSISR